MSAAFDVKWPKRAALRRVGQDAIDDLQAETLKPEDIGKRVNHGGAEEFAHVVWARKLVRIAGDIPDAGGLFIGVVLQKAPLVMQELLVPGTVFANWAVFETAVVGIKQAAIVHAKAKETRLVEMAVVKPTARNSVTSQLPTHVHPQQRFVPQPYPPYPQFPPSAPRPTAFTPPQQFQSQPAPRAYRPDSERLADLLKNIPVHHPPTAPGHAAYQKLIADWHTANPNQGPNELRPYPLSPGSAPLDAQGECFGCGMFGHITHDCTNPPMPPLEKKWRQIATSIRNGANGIPRRNAAQPTQIQYVTSPYHFNPSITYPYHPWTPPYTPQYHHSEFDAQDQGNGQGSST
ncbi:hypothetical protein C8J57DRAFT_1540123 [Mycena rebaudengoi]|nr:hypothetical protein C8J57DRAFT_1540123 [Mycena rebaudengoi]